MKSGYFLRVDAGIVALSARPNRDSMNALCTPRLLLRPFGRADFDIFVAEMLPDPAVVEFYHFYRQEADLTASVSLMSVMARATGHHHLGDFQLEDLTTFKKDMAELTRVAYGGVSA